MAEGGYDIGASLAMSSSQAASNSGATSASGGGGGNQSFGSPLSALTTKPNFIPWIVGGAVAVVLGIAAIIFITRT